LALECSIVALFALGKVRVWTLTLPSPAPEWKPVSSKWHRVLTWCAKRFDCRGIRVNEWHPGGHGWHIHWLTLAWIPVDAMRMQTDRVGFGRINVFLAGAGSQAAQEYFTKHWSKDFCRGRYGMRKWARTGGFKGSRVRDIKVESDYSVWRREMVGPGRVSYKRELELRHEYVFGRALPAKVSGGPTPFRAPF